MEAKSLFFTAPQKVEIISNSITKNEDQVLVKNIISAISAGTELLLYHNRIPDLPDDGKLGNINSASYPLKYGYASLGEVVEVGQNTDQSLLGKTVFSFSPHEEYSAVYPDNLIILPTDRQLTHEDLIFLANMETALSLVQDARPLIGEKVTVLGQGVVGLLTTSLLSKFPLNSLTVIDPVQQRQTKALELGAQLALSQLPTDIDEQDLVFELSGKPEVMNSAIELCGFESRIVLGSWYGKQASHLNLGGSFHRNRINIISSQVSHLSPSLTGRWDKARRFKTVFDMLEKVQPRNLISHRFPLENAEEAYALLANEAEKCLQIVFEYP